jgi:hypothetical protein
MQPLAPVKRIRRPATILSQFLLTVILSGLRLAIPQGPCHERFNPGLLPHCKKITDILNADTLKIYA